MIEVVAVMSVHPTSENSTVLQLSGSPANAAPARLKTTAADKAKAEILMMVLPVIGAGTASAVRRLYESIDASRWTVKCEKSPGRTFELGAASS